MEDLPEDDQALSRLLLRLMGSPDSRQIDGLGGGTSLTSKVMMVRPAQERETPARVAFRFAQVDVESAFVDYGGTCGNCTTAVALYAIDKGLVPAVEPTTRVRMLNLNTDGAVSVEVGVRGGQVCSDGDTVIPGVPGSGPGMLVWFEDPVGAITGRVHPTGNDIDRVSLGDRTVDVAALDVVNPVVFVRASDLGASGRESVEEMRRSPALIEDLRAIRAWYAVELGLARTRQEATQVSPGLPKVVMVGVPKSPATSAVATPDLCVRTLSMGQPHAAFALSSAACTAYAVVEQGPLLASLQTPVSTKGSAPGPGRRSVTLEHPSGALRVEVDRGDAQHPTRLGVVRTARVLAEGIAAVPPL